MFGGVLMEITVKKDMTANVWVAICDDIGLVLESGSYDALMERIKVVVPELIQLNNIPSDTKFFICTENQQMVCI